MSEANRLKIETTTAKGPNLLDNRSQKILDKNQLILNQEFKNLSKSLKKRLMMSSQVSNNEIRLIINCLKIESQFDGSNRNTF